MNRVMDVLYVRAIEKRLRRKLSDEEKDGAPSMIQFPNGQYERIQVPYLIFPYELMSQPEEVPETADKGLFNVA